jgi:hypothetical protein
MGADKVEAATTEGTPELEARLGEGLLALTAVKGEHLDVYAKRLHVLDQVAHEAARRRVGLGRVHVGETEHIHPTLSGVWRVTGCGAAHARPRGLKRASCGPRRGSGGARIRATSQEAQRGSPRGTPLPHQP